MRVPSAEELAAIAAAYLAVNRTNAAPAVADEARWRLAGRLPALDDAARVRTVSRTATRWKLAGRLDG